MKRNKYKGLIFLLPSLIGVLAFYLIPFLDVVRRSFSKAMGGGFAGISNYREVLSNQAFRLAAGNMLRFLIVCLPILLCLSLAVAVLLKAAGDAAGFFESSFLLPLALPAASIALLWQAAFGGKGLVNGVLEGLGMEAVDWMGGGCAFGVLVFTYVWKNLGYDVVLWLAGISSVPAELYEAARVDGAGRVDCFCHITIPLLRPVAVLTAALSFLNSFKVFREAYLVAGDYPQEDVYLLQHLFNNWFRDLSIDKMSAGAVLIALSVLVPACCFRDRGRDDWQGRDGR